MIEVLKGVKLDYQDGKVVLTAEVKALVQPKIEELKAKIASGEIDPIKGTDIDKMAFLAALELVEKAL